MNFGVATVNMLWQPLMTVANLRSLREYSGFYPFEVACLKLATALRERGGLHRKKVLKPTVARVARVARKRGVARVARVATIHCTYHPSEKCENCKYKNECKLKG